ncbi:MAG TPA: PAS domain S-box protein [Anaeromyxobacteraceae bacterium]|nr:PAS domain S-box protein [Anaeromyxobacteraceae bacterium]
MSLLPALTAAAAALAAALAVLLLRERARHASCERTGRRMRRLALLAESAHDVLLMFDDEGRIVETNARATAIYGWSRDELQSMGVKDLRAQGSRDGLSGQFYRAMEGERFTFETRHRRRDGSEFPVEVSTSSVEVDGARWVLSIVRDVTDRHLAEAALRESEAKFREAFHGASVGIALVDGTGALAEWNDALEAMLGYSGEELARLRYQDLLLPEDRAESLAAFGAIVRGERDHNDMERRYVHKDGRVLHLRYRVAALRDADGRLHRAIGIVEDVTPRVEAEAERRRMQEQLALTDRMASLGTLAATVAHEINNPLTYVVGNVDVARVVAGELAAERGGDPAVAGPLAEIAEALGEAVDGAARVRQIVSDLKILSSPGTEQRLHRVDVREALQAAVNLGRRMIAGRAELVTDLAEVPPVEGNTARLAQVFLNLLVNAAQAIPEGRAGANQVRAACRVDGDGRVVVEVSDTGSGIPPERLPRIFDPFYTTKPQGVGTGLGLAICRSIVSAHGGEIRVDTEVGRGTTFRVSLPAAGAAPRAEPPTAARGAAAEPAPTRRGRILVVDDEPFVLRALERILAAHHDVVLAPSAAEALARISGGAPIDGILCDVMMPGMDGTELYGEIERRAPALASRVVFVTGGALIDGFRAFLARTGVPVIEKPFAPDRVLALVARWVAAGPAVTRPTPRA